MSTMRGMQWGIRSLKASSSKPRQIRYATTAMRMPAMSPTMTEGGITSWKKEEGESFTAGDVLLEVETDKATIDVEAQDDGVMGKIVAQAGSNKIPVGQIIAMLAEEGDDLGSITVPSDLGPEGSAGSSSSDSSASEEKSQKNEDKAKEDKETSASSPSSSKDSTQAETAPKVDGHKSVKHSKPLFPSVQRLLQESSLSSTQISKLKGTGKNGMLTKGDVLLALGKIKSAWGSAEKLSTDVLGPSGKRKSEAGTTSTPAKEEPLDGPALRRLILAGMTRATAPAKPILEHSSSALPASPTSDFDALLAPYHSLLPPHQPQIRLPTRDTLVELESVGKVGVETVPRPNRDEWAGLL